MLRSYRKILKNSEKRLWPIYRKGIEENMEYFNKNPEHMELYGNYIEQNKHYCVTL